MLSVENLQLKYGKIPVIHDVSLKVDQGEIVAIVGGNGNGKSSILRGIAGVVQPAAGTVTFEGRNISKLESYDIVSLGISLVPEGRRLFPNLSVHKNLLLGAYLTRDKVEIEKRLDFVHGIFPILKERSGQKASTLSGGEQQMVAIGRGLMSNPRLLMLDEPSWGIAPKLVDRIFDVVREIRANGVTILLVEQDVEDALEISDRAYVIQTGRVALEGKSAEVLSSDLIQKAFFGL
ncbi:MAG TPA: ABC transporter ATP-binding protein [Syntrophales bacterium]|nr:ABC transporter ATP-binding protein [Syntrophales bacterium]